MESSPDAPVTVRLRDSGARYVHVDNLLANQGVTLVILRMAQALTLGGVQSPRRVLGDEGGE